MGQGLLPDRVDRLAFAAGAVLVGGAIIGMRSATDPALVRVFDNLHWTSGYAIGALLAWLGWHRGSRQGISDADRRSRLWFALGMTAYALGQVAWDIQVLLGWNPFPGPSDILFLMLGPGCLMGFLAAQGRSSSTLGRQVLRLELLIVSVVSAALALLVYLPKGMETEPWIIAFLIAYPIFLLSATGAGLLLVLKRRPRPATAWMLVILAIAVDSVLWLEWNARTLEGTLADGVWFNAFFSLTALCAGVGANNWTIVADADSRYRRVSQAIDDRLAPAMVVLAAAVTASALLMGPLSLSTRWVLAVGCVAAALLSLLRQSYLVQELRQTQSQLELAHAVARIGHWTMRNYRLSGKRISGTITMSPQALQILGLNQGNFDGLTVQDFAERYVHPADRAKYLNAWRSNRMNNASPETLDYRYLHPSGGTIMIRSTVHQGSGESGGNLFGVLQDITDISAKELRAQRLEAQLGRVQELAQIGFWWDILPHTPERISTVSPQLRDIFGADIDPGAGFEPDTEFIDRLVAPEDRERVRQVYADMHVGLRRAYDIEYRIHRPDGQVASLREICERTTDPVTGEIIERGMIQDITREHQRRREITDAQQKAEAANRAKSTFLATMSHELRTPLNAIIGFSSLIESEYFGPMENRKYKDYVSDIHASGKYLLSLINDILDLSRIEASKYDFDIRHLDAPAAMRDVAALMEPLALEKGVNLVAPDASVEGMCLGDRRAVHQILMNLVGNAIKFTEPGGSVRLRIDTEESNGTLALIVEDSGRGIAPERIAELGQPFVQVGAADTRDQGGSGLGLAISKALAKGMGGSIGIESRLGHGTSVRLILPASTGA